MRAVEKLSVTIKNTITSTNNIVTSNMSANNNNHIVTAAVCAWLTSGRAARHGCGFRGGALDFDLGLNGRSGWD